MISRRSFLGQTAGFTFLLAGGRRVWALPPAAETITVFKSRTCGCCADWVDYLKAEGFATVVHDEEEMDMVKDNLGVPAKVRSCHTGQVGKYLVEGHVPAEDIRRFLAERPEYAGLAVPGMPSGSPGMEGAYKDKFNVVAFTQEGTQKVYASR